MQQFCLSLLDFVFEAAKRAVVVAAAGFALTKVEGRDVGLVTYAAGFILFIAWLLAWSLSENAADQHPTARKSALRLAVSFVLAGAMSGLISALYQSDASLLAP